MGKKEILDKVSLSTQAHILEFNELKLKGRVWRLKITTDKILKESHQNYKVAMSFDEKPDMDLIAKIQKDLDSGLFKADGISRKNAQKSIDRIEKEMAEKKELCEDIKFPATILELKYVPGGTSLVMIIPDKVIEAFNRQKMQLKELYKIELEPTL